MLEQTISLLLADTQDPAGAKQVGVSLAEIYYLGPRALGTTLEVLGCELTQGLPGNRAEAIHPRLVRLLSGIATGFVERSQNEVLREQENIRTTLLKECHKAEMHYRTLVEQIPATTYVGDNPDEFGSTTYVSPQIEDMVGYPAEDFLEDPGLWRRVLHPEDRERVLGEAARSRKTGEPFRCEYRMVTRDGREIWVQDNATLVRDEQDRAFFWQGIKINVTERKNSESELREAEERFRSAFYNTPVGMAIVNLEGRYLRVNEALCKILGYSEQELLEMTFQELTAPEDYEKSMAYARRMWNGELDTYSLEKRYLHAGGHSVWVSLHVSLVKDMEGRPLYHIVQARDVTQRKQAEAALKENEERFRSLTEAAFEGIAISDDGTILETNQAFSQIFGYEPGEVIGMGAPDLIAPESWDLVHRVISSGYEEPYEAVGLKKDGTLIDLEIRGRTSSYQGRTVRLIALRDITARKQAEATLRDDADRLTEIIAIQQEIAGTEPDRGALMRLIAERTQNLTRADGAVVELIEDDELVYHAGSGILADRIGLRLKISASLSGACVSKGEPLLCEDTEKDSRVDRNVCRKTGAKSLIVAPLYHARSAVGVLKVASRETSFFGERDVDTLRLMSGLIAAAMSHAAEFQAKQALLEERTAALARIREREEKFRTIFNGAAVGVAVVNLEGRFMETNAALQEMLGYDETELRGMGFVEITHPDDVEPDTSLSKELAAGKRDYYEIEKRYIRKDGRLLWGRLKVSLVRGPGGEPGFFIGMVEDITERKRAERRRSVQYSVSRLLAESPAFDDMTQKILRLMGRDLGWDYAGFWIVDQEKDILRCVVNWHSPFADTEEFAATSNETRFARGEGLPGRAWDTGDLVWVPDISSTTLNFSRLGSAVAAGLHTGFGYPIRVEDRVLGVLEFFSRRSQELDRDAVDVVRGLSNQIGQFVERKRAEEALRKSEREYRRLFELANDAILIYEPESRKILDVNENACEIYGYPKEVFTGMTMKELSLDRQRARRYLNTLLARGSYQDFETIHRRADGTPINILANSSVIDFDGSKAILSINRDITARKRAAESLMEIREAERRRIARDLHDAVLQDLSGALQGLQATRIESENVGMEQELCSPPPGGWRPAQRHSRPAAGEGSTIHPGSRVTVGVQPPDDARTKDKANRPGRLSPRASARSKRRVPAHPSRISGQHPPPLRCPKRRGQALEDGEPGVGRGVRRRQRLRPGNHPRGAGTIRDAGAGRRPQRNPEDRE